MTKRDLLPEGKVFIGIDPGEEGFICVRDGNEATFHPMPTERIETGGVTAKGTPKFKEVFSLKGLSRLINEIAIDVAGKDVYVAIEDVHAIFGSAAGSTFNFGYTVGAQYMAIQFLNATIVPVTPKKWQSVMWKGANIISKPSSTGKTNVNDTKATSEAVAIDMFPGMDLKRSSRCRTNDDNKIDSLLISEWMIKQFNAGKI